MAHPLDDIVTPGIGRSREPSWRGSGLVTHYAAPVAPFAIIAGQFREPPLQPVAGVQPLGRLACDPAIDREAQRRRATSWAPPAPPPLARPGWPAIGFGPGLALLFLAVLFAAGVMGLATMRAEEAARLAAVFR